MLRKNIQNKTIQFKFNFKTKLLIKKQTRHSKPFLVLSTLVNDNTNDNKCAR